MFEFEKIQLENVIVWFGGIWFMLCIIGILYMMIQGWKDCYWILFCYYFDLIKKVEKSGIEFMFIDFIDYVIVI